MSVAGVREAPPFDLRSFVPDSPMTAADDAWLKAGLVHAMPEMRLPALYAARPDVFSSSERLVVAVRQGTDRPLAALGSRWGHTATGTRFLHIGVQFIAGECRRGPVFSASWLRLLADMIDEDGFPRIAVLKTYNPVAYCAMRAYGRIAGAVMYPDVERDAQDPEAVLLAAQVADALAPGVPFDAGTGVLPGIGVPADLYVQEPVSEDDRVNEHFAAHTRPGDRVLCLVHVRSAATEDAILAAFRQRSHRHP